MGTNFARLIDGIKVYMIEKLKKGEHYAFKLHLDVLSTVLKILDEVKR